VTKPPFSFENLEQFVRKRSVKNRVKLFIRLMYESIDCLGVRDV